MRFLILADIHANWYALEAVLEDAKGAYDEVVCCGDLVGYNPHPDQVIDWVQANCRTVIRGNHDKVVAGLERLDWFNEIAQTAARWTIQKMRWDNIEYLKGLAKGPTVVDTFQICHGSIRDEDEYVTSAFEAQTTVGLLDSNLLFFGHSHLQGGFVQRRNKINAIAAVGKQDKERSFELEVDTRYMINPGSVGQPRDGDARAAYSIYDSERRFVTLHRISYPIVKTIADIRFEGLPDVLGIRLLHGL